MEFTGVLHACGIFKSFGHDVGFATSWNFSHPFGIFRVLAMSGLGFSVDVNFWVLRDFLVGFSTKGHCIFWLAKWSNIHNCVICACSCTCKLL